MVVLKPAIRGALLAAAVLLAAGCSSVTFRPAEGEEPRDPLPDDHPVTLLSREEAQGMDMLIIGTVSCQDSVSSSLWNFWTDLHALIEDAKAGNEERLIDETREVGGEALVDLRHDIAGGGSGAGGVGVGVGMGSGGVGVGVGTTILGSNPKVTVISHGMVAVRKTE